MATLAHEIGLYVDPIVACLLGILMIGVLILLSLDFLKIRVRPRRRYYPRICYQCGKPWDGNHYCK